MTETRLAEALEGDLARVAAFAASVAGSEKDDRITLALKIALARWLSEKTAVPLRWVGQTLAAGHYRRVIQAVSRMSRKPGRKLEKMKQCLLKTKKTFEK